MKVTRAPDRRHRRSATVGAVIDHLGIQVTDMAAARNWYDAVLAPLDAAVLMDFGPALGYGVVDGTPHFWLSAATEPVGRENHVAFTTTERSVVNAVHGVAADRGIEVLHAPREWPEYHPGYYAVFLRDLDGNNVEVVCHVPA